MLDGNKLYERQGISCVVYHVVTKGLIETVTFEWKK